MPITRVNGIGLHVLRSGRGTDVVMVHGLATSLAFWWFSVVPVFRDQFGMTAFDLRGHGKSDMPPRGYTVADNASDLEALLDSLGIERTHLVGHSFGGEVALQLASRQPERVRSLTLADARIRAVQPVNRLEDWPNRDQIRRELKRAAVEVDDGDDEAGQHLLEALASGGRTELVHALGGDAEVAQGGLGRWGPRGAAQWLRLLATTTARRDLCLPSGLTRLEISRLRTPVLAVYGEWSPCLPSLRALQRLVPSCRTVISRRAGHFHPVTRPETFATALHRFIDSVDRAERRRSRAHRVVSSRLLPAAPPLSHDCEVDRLR